MDPAEFAHLRSALENQGALLGTHQQDIQHVTENLRAVTDTLASLTAQIQQMQASRTLAPVAPTPIATPISPHEPRLPAPPTYDGDPNTCRSFLSQCSLVLELQASSFPTERSKVAYIITLLSGKAREWATAVWDAQDACCGNFRSFTAEMRKVFDRSSTGHQAAGQILNLRQGSRSVFNYAIEFRTLAASCGWDDQALFDAFLHGLSDSVKDELSARELPSSLQGLIDLAGRIDARKRLRQQERNLDTRSFQPQTLPCPLETPPEPMLVDRARISPQERQRRRDEGACFYCGQSGHLLRVCPLKGKAPR